MQNIIVLPGTDTVSIFISVDFVHVIHTNKLTVFNDIFGHFTTFQLFVDSFFTAVQCKVYM